MAMVQLWSHCAAVNTMTTVPVNNPIKLIGSPNGALILSLLGSVASVLCGVGTSSTQQGQSDKRGYTSSGL